MVTDQTMSDIRRAALAMGPLIREQADEIERQRRLTPPVIEAMKQAGIYAMSMPKAWGGLELDLPEQLRVIETRARFDGSVGWCAEMSTSNGYMSSWFSDGAGKELFHNASDAWAAASSSAAKPCVPTEAITSAADGRLPALATRQTCSVSLVGSSIATVPA